MREIPKALNVVIRPIDNACNLHCTYCNIEYLYTHPYKDVFHKGITSLKSWFPRLLEQLNSIPEITNVTFTWHGGEPMLIPEDTFKTVLGWQDSYLVRPDLAWINVIQTNATLLSEEKIDFLVNCGIDIGVSLDGPDYGHNRFRFESRRDFEMVKGNIRLLRDKQVPFAIILVIHEKNCEDAESVMSFLADLNPTNGVAIPPLFTSASSYLEPSRYLEFSKRLFDEWWKCGSPIHISIFENILRGLRGQPPLLCYFINKCNSFVSIDSCGSLYGTCEPNRFFYLGDLSVDSLRDMLAKNTLLLSSTRNTVRNKSMFEVLGEDIKYRYFIGNYCPNRLVGDKDPYTDGFAELVNYIQQKTQV